MPQNFIWYELATADTPAAEKFYAAVVGWKMQQFDGEPAIHRARGR